MTHQNNQAAPSTAPVGVAAFTLPSHPVAVYRAGARYVSGLRVTLNGCSLTLWVVKNSAEALHQKLASLWQEANPDVGDNAAIPKVLKGNCADVKAAIQYGDTEEVGKTLIAGYSYELYRTGKPVSLAEEAEKDEWVVETSHSLRVRIGSYELWSRKGRQVFSNEQYARNAVNDVRALAAFIEQARLVTKGWEHPEKLTKAIKIEAILPKESWENVTLAK